MRVLVTGGSGRLELELQTELPRLGIEAFFPTRAELDVTLPDTIRAAIERYRPDVVAHAAAYTDVKGAEAEKKLCWRVNVGGTRNVVRALAGSAAKLVHISTDYVFWGDRGGYTEDDPVGPARNYYALSKLVAEEVARVHTNTLVIRTSFRPCEWPYPVAFTDVHTGQDYVDVIAPDVALAIRHAPEIADQALHIASERKSVYELARRRSSTVSPGTRCEAGVELPEDISLSTERWDTLSSRWARPWRYRHSHVQSTR
ncbi:MAG: NAD(P)-dependent oxidoreductase [Actinobacteria bacterium]|nr:MAG: NAD(P)-dependent oxidoreductase [Actinomycetota bacterium]